MVERIELALLLITRMDNPGHENSYLAREVRAGIKEIRGQKAHKGLLQME